MRKENPLYKGYSPDVIGRNISEVLSKGVPHAQAIAIALTTARREYRAKHPTGPFPRHLKMVGKVRMKNPAVKKLKWSIYAGGTSAAEGKHGYSAHPEIGNYKIDPISYSNGRHKGYSLRFENVLGYLSGGLHQQIGVFSSPNKAKQAANLHYLENVGIRKNPISEKTAHKLRKAAPKTFQYMTDEEIKRGVKVKKKRKVKEMRKNKKRRKNPASTLIKVFKHGHGEKKFQQVGYFTGTGWDTSIAKAEKYSAGAARQLATQLKVPAGWGLALVTG